MPATKGNDDTYVGTVSFLEESLGPGLWMWDRIWDIIWVRLDLVLVAQLSSADSWL